MESFNGEMIYWNTPRQTNLSRRADNYCPVREYEEFAITSSLTIHNVTPHQWRIR